MALAHVTASINKPSFVPGETIRLTLRFETTVEDLETVSNISVNFYRVDVQRNQFSLGFGSAPTLEGNTLEVSKALPTNFRYGLYIIQHVTLCRGDEPEESEQEAIAFDPVFFAVRTAVELPLSSQEVFGLSNEMGRRRTAYMRQPIKTTKAEENTLSVKQFRVMIFGVGCLLHATQQLEGYSITPLGTGLSHRRMHEIVNTALEGEGTEGLLFSEETEEQFERSTPVFRILYTTVEAIDHNDAIDHCRAHANLLFQILGLDRGQMPREFACVASEYESNRRWHLYQMPGYRGNLLSDFNPVSTANRIEQTLPKLQADSFARLLLKTYADATAELDYGFSLLRYWSVLELVADKSIAKDRTPLAHPDGAPILNRKGKPETTNSKHGRVYAHILANDAFKSHGTYTENGSQKSYMVGRDSSDPAYTPTTELITLWDLIRAVYAIRNLVAHEGQFDLDKAMTGDAYQQLAARLKKLSNPDPLRFIKQQAQQVIWREV